MESILNFLIENKVIFGGVGIAIVAFWDKIKVLVSSVKGKIKIPFVAGSSPNQELADQEALRHLRNRAVEFGNKELMALIKEIDTRFYDIHTGVKNEK